MRVPKLLLLLLGVQCGVASVGLAASYQVTPMSVEIRAPGATSSVTVKNDGDAAMNAQIRVYRWTQTNGQEKLEPTTDVVASPPMTNVLPKSEQTIRLVRTSKQPLAGEESYRIYIDEIPDPSKRKSGQVAVALRYSIPVFFVPPTPTESKVGWTIKRTGEGTIVFATNNGDRRVKLSGMKIKDQAGNVVALGEGLNGYVLARSTMRWVLPGNAAKLGLNGPVAISARGDDGLINVQAQATPAQ